MQPTEVRIHTEFAHKHGLPAYETAGAAGMDVRANEEVFIEPGDTRLIKTGIFVAIPEGFEIQVRPRSGMSLKTKLRIANAPGTIDSDYRGELCIIAQNVGAKNESPYQAIHIELGDRIAQIVLQRVPVIEWVKVNARNHLGDTARAENGGGSTGTR